MFTTATAILAAKALGGYIGREIIRGVCSDKKGKLTPAGHALSLALMLGLACSGDIPSLLGSVGSEAASAAA